MDRAFTQELMEKTGFPAEARQAFTRAEEQLLSAGQEEALDGAVRVRIARDPADEDGRRITIEGGARFADLGL